jgi:hypothetical protein
MQNFTGCLDDTRPEEEKLKDWTHKEIVAKTASVVWTDRMATIKKYPQRNQDGSYTCVMQTCAKMLGINNANESGAYVDLSAFDGYDRRSNKPQGGMIGNDAFQIVKDYGLTLDQFIPSQKLGEPASVDRKPFMEDVGKVFRIANYAILPIDIDEIASVLALGTPVMLWFEYFYDEWGNVPTLKHNETTAPSRHSITGVNFTLYQGKKAIYAEDSTPVSGQDNGQRILTEDFIKARCIYAAYSFDLKNGATIPEAQPDDPVLAKPKYIGGQLKFGDKSDKVKNLQNVLKYDGEFLMEQSSTGLYGAITAKAVLAYQLKYSVSSLEELNSLAGRVVGPATAKDLESRYN